MNPILQAIFGVVSGPLDTLLARFFPSADDRQKAMMEIQLELQKNQDVITQAAVAAQQGQIAVNNTEASSASVFVAGWRPATGWICGFALAYNFILQPMATWGIVVLSAYQHVSIPPLPALDIGPLMTVLLGMLGLTAARTVEKLQGVSRANMRSL